MPPIAGFATPLDMFPESAKYVEGLAVYWTSEKIGKALEWTMPIRASLALVLVVLEILAAAKRVQAVVWEYYICYRMVTERLTCFDDARLAAVEWQPERWC